MKCPSRYSRWTQTIYGSVLTAFCALPILISTSIGQSPGSITAQRDWGKKAGGFQLSIGIDMNDIKVGQPVVLQLAIKNVTDQVLTLGEMSPERDYDIDVRESRGESVKFSKFGERLHGGIHKDRNLTIYAQPNREILSTIDVALQRDLSVPGTYSIRAARRVKKLDGSGWISVESNTISLKIVP